MNLINTALSEEALLKTIQKIEVLGPESSQDNQSQLFHVAFGVDENYAMSAGVAMTSLIIHNQDVQFCFHLFIDSMCFQDHQRFQKFAQVHNTSLRIYYLKREAFDALPTNGHITQATYYRLIIPLALRNQAQRVLYLDSDITCVASIKEMMSLDLSGCPAGVVSDLDEFVAKRAAKLQLKNGKYFNAGVLYIDIPEWNSQEISTKALNLFSGPLGEAAFLDQDALNLLLDGRSLFLERKWNYLYDMTYMTEKVQLPAVFLHYVGRVKPWKIFCQHEIKEYYISNAEKSQWANVAVEDPKNHREAKIYSRVLFKQGCWLEGLKWFYKYSYWKMSQSFK